ncbi:MAG: FAD-dependent oxidoreductase [Gammaproteobacteria bacterium]|nr:FAD-dependent oxidoreductase [Gammaproteobacteria bacterium]
MAALFPSGRAGVTLARAKARSATLTKEYEIVVIGGGIAGFSAALAAARLGRQTLVLTGETLGGHLITIEKIDGYPGFEDGVPGFDLCPIVQEQAETAGAETAMASVTSLERDGDSWHIVTPPESYHAKCVIIATGTKLRKLNVPGETKLHGKGVSQCASCDAPLLRNQAVVVAGGGDSALQEALTLADHCSKVTIVHHGAKLKAQAAYRTLAEAADKIEFIADAEVTEVLGDEAVTGVKIKHLGSGDASEIECAAIFGFIGLEPNAGFLADNSLVDDTGAVLTDALLRTRQTGLLAAGTVRAGSIGRAAAAAGEGAAAALAADRFLSDGAWRSD